MNPFFSDSFTGKEKRDGRSGKRSRSSKRRIPAQNGEFDSKKGGTGKEGVAAQRVSTQGMQRDA